MLFSEVKLFKSGKRKSQCHGVRLLDGHKKKNPTYAIVISTYMGKRSDIKLNETDQN